MGFILIGKRRVSESAVSAFKCTEGKVCYTTFRIRGKLEIVYFPDKESMKESSHYLITHLKDMVPVADWFIKRNLLQEYEPSFGPEVYYIKFKVGFISDTKVYFSNKEDLEEGLKRLDEMFDTK